MKGYLSENELNSLGLKKFGKEVLVHRDTKIYNPENISIGNYARIDPFSILSGIINIGNYVHIGNFCSLHGSHGITLKNFSGLSSRISVYTANEDYTNGTSLTNPTIPEEFRKFEVGSVTLEEHCIVGASSIILPSTHLKEGVAIGAFSLIRGTYEEWKVFAGIPTKFIKNRPKQIILNDAKRLLKTDSSTG